MGPSSRNLSPHIFFSTREKDEASPSSLSRSCRGSKATIISRVISRKRPHISSSHDSARSGGGHHPPKLGDKSGRREEEIFRPLPSSPEINSRAGSAEAEQLTSVGTQVSTSSLLPRFLELQTFQISRCSGSSTASRELLEG